MNPDEAMDDRIDRAVLEALREEFESRWPDASFDWRQYRGLFIDAATADWSAFLNDTLREITFRHWSRGAAFGLQWAETHRSTGTGGDDAR